MTLDHDGTQSWGLPTFDASTAGSRNVIVPMLQSGVLAREFCRSVSRANVEAIFERCFYLRCGSEFICVGEPDIGKGPFTLIGNLGRVSDLELQLGRAAAVCERQIVIGGSIRLILDQTETCCPPPWPNRASPVRLFDTCANLAWRAAIDAPEEGFARHVSGVRETSRRQSPLARAVRPRIALFERWLFGVLDERHTRGTAVEEVVQGLIGLGPGLTPSGDDFLVGALALLDAIGERGAHTELARVISDPLLALTTPLSASFLRAAAAGHVGEALHRTLSSVITGDVDSAVAAAGSVGHSSGWDTMAGIMTTLRIAVAPRLETPSTADAFAFS